ncbi:hypothetical protein AAC387_Pa10g1009 [Persea americana]
MRERHPSHPLSVQIQWLIQKVKQSELDIEREKASSFFRDPAQSKRQNPPNLRDETLPTLLSVLEKYSSQKPDDEAAAVPTRKALSTLFSSQNPLRFLETSRPKFQRNPSLDPLLRFLETLFGEARRWLPSSIKKTDDEALSTLFSIFEKYSLDKPDDDAAVPARRREVSIAIFQSSLQSSTTCWAMDYSTPTTSSQIQVYQILFI